MNRQLRLQVRLRAQRRCEYCLLHETDLPLFPFHVEHIIAQKHGGKSVLANLCWSCLYCNLAKSSNLSGIDPITNKIVALFHPRLQQWKRHFRLAGALLVGKSPPGRATIRVLNMNASHRVEIRRHLLRLGLYPRR